MSDTSLAAVVRTAAQRLADVGVPDPLVDAELLAGHILGRRRGEVHAAIVRGDGGTFPDDVEFNIVVIKQ